MTMGTRLIFHTSLLVSIFVINYTQVSGQGYSFKEEVPVQDGNNNSPSSAYTQDTRTECNPSNAEYRLRGSQNPPPPAMPYMYIAPEPRHRPGYPQDPEAARENNPDPYQSQQNSPASVPSPQQPMRPQNPPQSQNYPVQIPENPPQFQVYSQAPVENLPQFQGYPQSPEENPPQFQGYPQSPEENPPAYQNYPAQNPPNPPQYQPQPQQPQRPENPTQYQPQPQPQQPQRPENPPQYQPQPQQPQIPENPPQYQPQPQPQQPQRTENPPQYQPHPQPQQPQRPENPPQYQPQPQPQQLQRPENPSQYQPQPQPQQPQRPANPPQSPSPLDQMDTRTGKSLSKPPTPVNPGTPSQNQIGGTEAPTNPSSPQPGNNNRLNDPSPNQQVNPAELTQLLSKLNNKIKDLEETQDALNKNIDELQEKLARRAKINSTASFLNENKPKEAVEGWKELKENVDSPQDLQNVTNEVVNEACDQNTPPQLVMDFVHQIPAQPTVKDSAYRTLADKIQDSEALQEQMYWREMTPYCQQVAQNIGPASPTTSKMLNLQDQMRLQAAKPIKECTGFINQQEYQPAVMSWTNMTADIPDNSNQLNTNMEKIVTKAYGGNPENIQYVFYFIIILPQSQNEFREVAYNCLQREMSANGHFYDPNTQTGGQIQQLQGQQTQQVPYYTVGHVKN